MTKNILMILIFSILTSGCFVSGNKLSRDRVEFPFPEGTKVTGFKEGENGWEQTGGQEILIIHPDSQVYYTCPPDRDIDACVQNFVLIPLEDNFYAAEHFVLFGGYYYNLVQFSEEGFYRWDQSLLKVVMEDEDFQAVIEAECIDPSMTQPKCEIDSFEDLIKIKDYIVEMAVDPDYFYTFELPVE